MSETPVSSARKLLAHYAITDPADVLIEDLIWAQGGIYEEKPMTGAEGRIVFAGSKSAFVVINQKIINPEKKRFIRAHELGHLQMHRSLRPFFHCDVQAFRERNKQGSHESEANAFAAELLMPEQLFMPLMEGQPFSVELLQRTARRFKVSLMAMSFRYMELGTEPIAVLFSQDGHIKWANRSIDFIVNYLPTNRPLPERSATYGYVVTGVAPTEPTLIPAEVWFNNRRIPNDLLFYEQCVLLTTVNGALTYIWMSNQFR